VAWRRAKLIGIIYKILFAKKPKPRGEKDLITSSLESLVRNLTVIPPNNCIPILQELREHLAIHEPGQ